MLGDNKSAQEEHLPAALGALWHFLQGKQGHLKEQDCNGPIDDDNHDHAGADADPAAVLTDDDE